MGRSKTKRETKKVVNEEWIYQASKVLAELVNDEEVNLFWGYSNMTERDIEEYFHGMPAEMREEELGYALGNFHSAVRWQGGPINKVLVGSKWKVMNQEYKVCPDGGGFFHLTKSQKEFLASEGYETFDEGDKTFIKGLIKSAKVNS